MFGIGISELLLILIVAFVVVGPDKLPKMARTLGKALFEVRRAAEDFRESIEDEGAFLKDTLREEEAGTGAKKGQ